MATNENLGNISDFIKEKYNGTKPELFRKFMEDFELAVKTLDIPITKQYLYLQNNLEGTPRDIAGKIIEEFEQDHPLILNGTDGQQRQQASNLMRQLKTKLKADPAVVGVRPTDKLLAKWGKLSQKDGELVRAYYHRFIELRDTLKKADPPEEFSEKQQVNIFVGVTRDTGLLPPIQLHVKVSGKDNTLQSALEAAEAYESAHEGFSKGRSGTHVRSVTATAGSAEHDIDDEGFTRSTKRGIEDIASEERGDSRLMGENGSVNYTRYPRHASPGCENLVCLHFLKHGHCKYGDECRRRHHRNWGDQNDVRDCVKQTTTREMWDSAHEHANGGPPQFSGSAVPQHDTQQLLELQERHERMLDQMLTAERSFEDATRNCYIDPGIKDAYLKACNVLNGIRKQGETVTTTNNDDNEHDGSGREEDNDPAALFDNGNVMTVRANFDDDSNDSMLATMRNKLSAVSLNENKTDEENMRSGEHLTGIM